MEIKCKVSFTLPEDLIEALGKIQIHNIVSLHNNVINSDKIKRIIYILHQIQYENLDIVLTSDR